MNSIKISKIEITDLQARADTDQRTIDEYAEGFKTGEKFPPVIVFHDGSKNFLADGFHRYFGAKAAGLTEIVCDVRKGGRKEALWFAVAANRTHGLKRTNADKRKSVEIAIQERPELADNAIAKHVGVSQPLVSEVRRQVQVLEPDPILDTPKRTGSDGKKYPVPPSRKPLLTPPVSPKKTLTPPPLKPDPKAKPEPTKELDKTGHPIPEKVMALWNRSGEVQEILTTLSHVKSVLRKAQDEKDKLFAEVNFSTALSSLEQAWKSIQTAKPYAVCPTCQGMVSSQCRLCFGRGLISEYRWDTVVAREIKEIRFKARK